MTSRMTISCKPRPKIANMPVSPAASQPEYGSAQVAYRPGCAAYPGRSDESAPCAGRIASMAKQYVLPAEAEMGFRGSGWGATGWSATPFPDSTTSGGDPVRVTWSPLLPLLPDDLVAGTAEQVDHALEPLPVDDPGEGQGLVDVLLQRLQRVVGTAGGVGTGGSAGRLVLLLPAAAPLPLLLAEDALDVGEVLAD